MRPVPTLQFLALLSSLTLVLPEAGHAHWPADGRALCTADNAQSEPTSAPDGAGGAIVTWYDYRSGTDIDIYAQHILPTGAVDPVWPANGLAICTAAGTQRHPSIVSDGADGAIVTWYDGRSGDFDIYAQHVLSAGAVDSAWPAGGRALCTSAGDQSVPEIISDGAGGAIVTWDDRRVATGPENAFDIYAQHVLSTGAVDPAWPADGRALCTAVNNQRTPKISTDGAGGAIVTWTDFRNGASEIDVYAQHVLSTGTVDPAWPADGRALCTAANRQYSHGIVSDGAGGAIVVWQDWRNGINFTDDIYAQHVLSRGAVDPAWPVNGRAVCTATDSQVQPAMVADGAGGAIVAWQDARSGYFSSDVYAQHVLSTGAVDPAWPADGRAVCGADNQQFAPTSVTDGAGGAIVAWTDRRSGTAYDVYAQRILLTGVVDPAWPAGGRALCTAAGNQGVATIVTDGAGGAIAAWEDARRGATSDIYAQRVLSSGDLPPNVIPMALTLPATLNLRSMGRWVTAYLQPPAGLDAGAIDVTSIRFHGDVAGAEPVPADPAAPTAIGDQNVDAVPDLMVKFGRAAVELTLTDGAAVPVTVTGTVAGQPFGGTTTIRVLRAPIAAPAAGAVLDAGTVTTVRWQTPSRPEIQSVALLWSPDGGASWKLEARAIPNSGSYDWTVPGIGSTQARVAVALVESSDATEGMMEGVLGVSDPFTILGPAAIGVGEGTPSEFALHRVGPSPARGVMHVGFSLAGGPPARLDVLDVAGRLVMARDVGALGPGRHQVEVRSGLRAGVYLVRLRQGDQVRMARAVVLE